MADNPRKVLICSCEDTMPLDADAIKRGCRGANVLAGRQLCRAELGKFRTAVADGGPLTVGCTQEAPLFAELAEESDASITYVNIRETAGWSTDAAASGAKMAALIAAATEPAPEIPFVSFTSDGVVLIYGRDEQAVEAASLLKDHLDVTVLIKPPADIAPPRVTDFPVVKGTIRQAKGYLGAFEIVVDDYAQPAPSSRGALAFGTAKNNAVSHCDLLLDLSGGAPLFSASDLREGYLRADPGDPAAVMRVVVKARDLIGTFDKPRYITFTEDLCAHSRSKIVGCNRCLDLCPTGAIAPDGDHVTIDAHICAGCGQCAAVCPTGAASYALPPADTLMRRLRALLTTYREAGGTQPVVLLHDDAHGTPLIDALARFGDGLPANALPLAVNEVTQVGLETIAAALAYGAAAVRLLLRAKPRHDTAGLTRTLALAEPILTGLGFGPGRVATIETDDPDALGEALRTIDLAAPAPRPASFLPDGGKRDVMRLALRELQRAAPAPGRRHRIAGRRAVRRDRTRRRGLHALPRLRIGLPDRRAARRSRAADAALCRGCVRAVRTVQGDLPGESHHAQAATRLPRRDRERTRAQAGGTVPLHPLRQAVRRQEHDRARHRQARRQALDVPRLRTAARGAQDVRGLPGDCRNRGGLRSLRRAAAAEGAHH